jgi:hypothetical protein
VIRENVLRIEGQRLADAEAGPIQDQDGDSEGGFVT